MSKLPSIDTLKTELNGIMKKYNFSISWFSVRQDGENVVIGVMFTKNEKGEYL